MAKRKPDTSKQDAAVRYRARLEARQTALATAQTATWSPGLRDRLDLGFARLLHTATAPTTRASGIRKRVLERRVFRAATQSAAHRKAIYRASKAVVGAARVKDMATFRRANDELRRLWGAARADRKPAIKRRR